MKMILMMVVIVGLCVGCETLTTTESITNPSQLQNPDATERVPPEMPKNRGCVAETGGLRSVAASNRGVCNWLIM